MLDDITTWPTVDLGKSCHYNLEEKAAVVLLAFHNVVIITWSLWVISYPMLGFEATKSAFFVKKTESNLQLHNISTDLKSTQYANQFCAKTTW